MTESAENTPGLNSEHQQMLDFLKNVDVETQRSFAGLQAKIGLGILILGIGICFVYPDYWLPGLSYGVLFGTIFMMMSRAKHDYCDLTGLIQALARQQESDSTGE